jgi:predicted phosphate transport protein (TIGR00153 family)
MLMKKTKKLELQIDEYLDEITKGGQLFRQGIKFYLHKNKEQFEERIVEINAAENRADDLRRTIETKLYLHTLIPEHRGDVLGLLESSDKVLNLLTETLKQFSVEIPDIPEYMHKLFEDLAEATITSVENMVQAVRAYFKDYNLVRDLITKVIFYEKETTRIADQIKRDIFQDSTKELSYKIHIRYFAYHIERIAEVAEDVCDRLSIAVIKRFV